LRLAPELEASMGLTLEVSDFVSNVGGFDAMLAGLEALFSQEELGTYLIELCVELALGVVEVSVSLDFGDVSPVVELSNSRAEGVEGQRQAIEEEEKPGGHGLDWSIEIVGGVCVELGDIRYLIMVLPGKKLHLAIVSLTNLLGQMRVTCADRDGGGDLPRVEKEVVRAEGVFVIVGDLSFEQSNFLLKLLICASKRVGFNVMDGIAMLDGSNKSFCDILDSLGW